MIECRLLIALLYISASFADAFVSFPNDSPTNGTIQSRYEWTFGGKYQGVLDTFRDGHRSKIQTQTVVTTQTIPTENRSDESLPPLPSPFPVEVFTPVESFPSGDSSSSELDSVSVDDELCDCMPVGLCVNQTTRTGASTRIVTRPPVGISCPSGEVYCCAQTLQLGCGLPNIVPGVHPKNGQADLGEFPWSAIILTNDNGYVGGGVFIDANHVLTAAHKVARYGNGAGLKIRFGDWDLSNENEPVRYLEVKIARITNHPKFEANTLKNDISVIRLASPVASLTSPYPQINSICLPEATDVFTGSRCKVAGWGKDKFNGEYQNIIKKVEVPVLSSIDCQTKLRATRLGSSYVLDTNSFICAGGEAGRDACTGDGGNALACVKNGQYYVAGITAGGIECGNDGIPGLYVNVVNYLTWIKTATTGGGGDIDPRRNSG